MRVAILSDIHSNLAALEAVLEHCEKRQGLDAVWSLGDVVGYGPQPNEVVDALCRQNLVAVMGNHDLAASGGMDTEEFSDDAATTNRWNAAQLHEDQRDFLSGQQQIITQDTPSAVLCHGSLRWPIWEYLLSEEAAQAQFDQMTVPFSFVGHTHIPLVFEEREGGQKVRWSRLKDGHVLKLGRRRLIVNPGSVGQPRDGDPRAAYAILDTGKRTIEFFRVPYAIKATQTLMANAGLPVRQILRLGRGH